MQVILLERIEKLGFMGDVVVVKPGFARNYLLPQKKALRASKANLAYFQDQKAQLEATNLTRKQDAQAAADRIQGMVVVLVRQAGDSGQLYGSVTQRDIAQMARENGVAVSSQQARISTPIKALGIHKAALVLHPEVSVEIFVNVAKSVEEAQAQWANQGKSAAQVQEQIAGAERAKAKGRHDEDGADDADVLSVSETSSQA